MEFILRKIADDPIISDHVKSLQLSNYKIGDNIERFHASLGTYDLKS